VFGNMDSLKKPHLEELCTFDRLEEERGLDSEEKFGKGKNQGFFGLKKLINAQSSSMGLLTRTLFVNGSITSNQPIIRSHCSIL